MDAEQELTALRRANTELEAANRQLARGLMGKQDAAAAATVAKLERLEAENAQLNAQVEQLNTDLERERAWHDARRYHFVDAIHRRLRP